MLTLSQEMMFVVAICNSEPEFNSEAQGNNFWIIPRNTIDQGINKLQTSK